MERVWSWHGPREEFPRWFYTPLAHLQQARKGEKIFAHGAAEHYLINCSNTHIHTHTTSHEQMGWRTEAEREAERKTSLRNPFSLST